MSENLELEKTLWQAADKLRNNMDAAEYKHVVLGLIFLKFFMFHRKHVGTGYKAGQNYLQLGKTLTMQWTPLKKTMLL